jgi:hypothetical protein
MFHRNLCEYYRRSLLAPIVPVSGKAVDFLAALYRTDKFSVPVDLIVLGLFSTVGKVAL